MKFNGFIGYFILRTWLSNISHEGIWRLWGGFNLTEK